MTKPPHKPCKFRPHVWSEWWPHIDPVALDEPASLTRNCMRCGEVDEVEVIGMLMREFVVEEK